MDDDDEYLYGDQPATTTTHPLTTTTTTTAAAAATTASLPDPTPTPKPSNVVPGLSTSLPPDTPMSDPRPPDLESGEEEEEEIEVSDTSSEISFIIERKDGSRPEPPPVPSRYNQVRMAPSRPDSKPTPQQQRAEPSPIPANSTHPPTATSKLDLNANPAYNGTAITKIPLDSETLLPADKPWRKPGADVTDYFNYGFDEFTWTAYCQKQEGLREEFDPRKMMEQMMMLSGLGMGMGLPSIDPGNMDMSSMMAGAGFGMPGGNVPAGPGVTVPPTGPSAGAGGQDMAMGGMGDPGMYGGMQGVGYDERAGPQGAYNMPTDPRRTGMPPQGPNAGPQGHMGGYGGYDQGMMQGAGNRGGYVGRGGRGRRGGW